MRLQSLIAWANVTFNLAVNMTTFKPFMQLRPNSVTNLNPKTMRKYLTLLLLACAPLLFTGCLVAAVGAGVGAVKYGNAKHRDAYAKYRTEAEKNNTDREKSGLQPVKILTFDEWVKGKESTPTAPK
jgi:hypothetical protein